MTQDYKSDVLHYLVGDLPQEVEINTPQYENISTVQNDLYNKLRDYFSSMIIYKAFIPSKDNQNNGLNYSVLACYGTLIGETDPSGAFVIIDDNGELIQVITEYTNGTKVGIIQCLNVDSNGYFYGVEKRGNNYRIIELNNLVLKLSNQAKLKATVMKTHSISSSYDFTLITKILRNEDKSKYFILGETNSGSLVLDYNVSDNSWNYWSTSKKWTSSNVYSMFRQGWNAYWDSNGDLQFTLLIFGTNINADPALFKLTKGENNAMNELLLTQYEDTVLLQSEAAFYSNKYCYIATIESGNTTVTTNITLLDMETYNSALVASYTKPTSTYNQVWFFKSNDVMYYVQSLYDETIQEEDEYYTIYSGQLNGTAIYPVSFGGRAITGASSDRIMLPNIINQFNKNKICVQIKNTIYTTEFQWNPDQYNGLPYKSYTSLVPQKGAIDENGTEIFNRTLYNVAPYINRYTATFQIPDNYLNNNTIETAKIYSKNNNLMCSNDINTTKNKYEELNINVINKFNMINNDGTENIDGASDLVKYMVQANQNAAITKYRINYEDNTNEIKFVELGNSNPSNATIKLLFYVPKKIKNIELISNNENTIYQTIDTSSLETSKYYLISQRVKVE